MNFHRMIWFAIYCDYFVGNFYFVTDTSEVYLFLIVSVAEVGNIFDILLYFSPKDNG